MCARPQAHVCAQAHRRAPATRGVSDPMRMFHARATMAHAPQSPNHPGTRALSVKRRRITRGPPLDSVHSAWPCRGPGPSQQPSTSPQTIQIKPAQLGNRESGNRRRNRAPSPTASYAAAPGGSLRLSDDFLLCEVVAGVRHLLHTAPERMHAALFPRVSWRDATCVPARATERGNRRIK